jgi:hypothetical protein
MSAVLQNWSAATIGLEKSPPRGAPMGKDKRSNKAKKMTTDLQKRERQEGVIPHPERERERKATASPWLSHEARAQAPASGEREDERFFFSPGLFFSFFFFFFS